MVGAQKFSAGIEGTISYLKRAYLLRSVYIADLRIYVEEWEVRSFATM